MTNSEYLNEIVPEIGANIKTAIIVARGLDPNATYNGGKEVELVEADLYYRMMLIPEFKEGQLSIKYDLSSLRSFAQSIYKKWGDPRYESFGQPLIRSINL